MKDLDNIFNKATRHLNKRVSSIKGGLEELDAAATGIERDRTNSIEQVLKKVESIEGHLSAFKLR